MRRLSRQGPFELEASWLAVEGVRVELTSTSRRIVLDVSRTTKPLGSRQAARRQSFALQIDSPSACSRLCGFRALLPGSVRSELAHGPLRVAQERQDPL